MNNRLTIETFVIGNLEKDFLKRRNEAMLRSRSPLVMLLNTDIEVTNFDASISLFEDNEWLFAVTFSPESSKTGIVREVEVANGGSSIYRRETWNSLGGIDPMFEPYWYDDTDYSYRARRRGFYILEDGRIQVTQKGEMGVKILSRNPKAFFIHQRNRLLFLMKHRPEEYRRLRWRPKLLPALLAAKIRFHRFYPQGYQE
jgi:GT2 family glycosyltransferase